MKPEPEKSQLSDADRTNSTKLLLEVMGIDRYAAEFDDYAAQQKAKAEAKDKDKDKGKEEEGSKFENDLENYLQKLPLRNEQTELRAKALVVVGSALMQKQKTRTGKETVLSAGRGVIDAGTQYKAKISEFIQLCMQLIPPENKNMHHAVIVGLAWRMEVITAIEAITAKTVEVLDKQIDSYYAISIAPERLATYWVTMFWLSMGGAEEVYGEKFSAFLAAYLGLLKESADIKTAQGYAAEAIATLRGSEAIADLLDQELIDQAVLADLRNGEKNNPR
jgi:hypothetical protein